MKLQFICTKCHDLKDEDQFYDRTQSHWCIECRKKQTKSSPHATPENRRARTLRDRGLTVAQYDQMVKAQRGRCGICRKKPQRRLCVDHDHVTGVVRGLLCHKCNKALGLLGDSAKNLTKAIEYLEAANVHCG